MENSFPNNKFIGFGRDGRVSLSDGGGGGGGDAHLKGLVQCC